MTMLKLKFAAVAAVSLLGLSFEAAQLQQVDAGTVVAVGWFWFSQCPLFNLALAEP